MPAVAMLHEIDPREAIQKRVGNIDGVEVFGNDVLVAIYKRPQRTKSGIMLPDSTLDEDQHQGKVGLVLKMGATAFLDDEGNRFRDISVGDWVFFRPSDGWRITLNTLRGSYAKDDTVDCRIVNDLSIRGRIQHCDEVY